MVLSTFKRARPWYGELDLECAVFSARRDVDEIAILVIGVDDHRVSIDGCALDSAVGYILAGLCRRSIVAGIRAA